jgi:hypothetical protein
MQRMKDAGEDPLRPIFSAEKRKQESSAAISQAKRVEVSMTKPGVNRKITMEDLKAHSTEAQPWCHIFVERFCFDPLLTRVAGSSLTARFTMEQHFSKNILVDRSRSL